MEQAKAAMGGRREKRKRVRWRQLMLAVSNNIRVMDRPPIRADLSYLIADLFPKMAIVLGRRLSEMIFGVGAEMVLKGPGEVLLVGVAHVKSGFGDAPLPVLKKIPGLFKAKRP